MPKREMPIRYYGVPETERPARAKEYERDIAEDLREVDRYALRLPKKYHALAVQAAAAVEGIAEKYGSAEIPLSAENIFLVPDPHFEGSSEQTTGTFSPRSGLIKLRLSELFHVSESKREWLWSYIQTSVRESFVRMYEKQIDQIEVSTDDQRASHALMAVFDVDELSQLFWEKQSSFVEIKSLIAERIAERIKTPRLAKEMSESIDKLFSPNDSFNYTDSVSLASNDQERVAEQVRVMGRAARRVASERVAEACLQIADSERVNAVKATLTHEFVHARSKNFITAFREGVATRTGYSIPVKELGEPDSFESLNEAFTETITRQAMAKMKQPSEQGVEDTNPFEAPGFYRKDRLLLQAILKGIAAKRGEALSVTWERFERGYFTGESMQLRDIQKIFGKEAWDFYKALKPDDLGKPTEEIRAKVKQHFSLELPLPVPKTGLSDF